jgi:hypothetical protein
MLRRPSTSWRRRETWKRRCATSSPAGRESWVLDLNMPGTARLPALPRFIAAAPGTAIVVMTMQDDLAFAREALSAGASGYVLKAGAEAELVEAVRAAAAGRTYLDPALGARLAATPPGPGAAAATNAERGPEVEVGSTFAGHRIDAVAGRGGMATVFRATDLTLGRSVALKLIDPSLAGDPVFRARFERECRLAAALDHPNIVDVFHAGEERGLLYVTMRYVDGPTCGRCSPNAPPSSLRTRSRSSRRSPMRSTRRIGTD